MVQETTSEYPGWLTFGVKHPSSLRSDPCVVFATNAVTSRKLYLSETYFFACQYGDGAVKVTPRVEVTSQVASTVLTLKREKTLIKKKKIKTLRVDSLSKNMISLRTTLSIQLHRLPENVYIVEGRSFFLQDLRPLPQFDKGMEPALPKKVVILVWGSKMLTLTLWSCHEHVKN